MNLDTLRDAVIDLIEEDDLDVIDSALNHAIEITCKENGWTALRESVEVTTNASGEIIVPPRCDRVNVIISAEKYGNYMAGKYSPTDTAQTLDRPVLLGMTTVPVGAMTMVTASGFLLSPIAGETVIPQYATSSVDIPADIEGMQLQIKGDNEIYEVVSSIAGTSVTVKPAVSVSSAATSATVGVLNQLFYKLINADGSVVGDGITVTIEYQARHPRLTDSDSRLMIPCGQTIYLKACQTLMIGNKYSVDADRLQRLIEEARSAEFSTQFDKKNRKRQPNNSRFTVSRRW